MDGTVLRQSRKRAKRWAALADDVSNLPESSTGVGRVLTPEEKALLFHLPNEAPCKGECSNNRRHSRYGAFPVSAGEVAQSFCRSGVIQA